jgi:hypothetical protein
VTFHQRKREALELFVLSQKSDPFARGRAEAHLRNGIIGVNDQGQDCFYSAEAYQESRYLPSKDGVPGEEYFVTSYKNVKVV